MARTLAAAHVETMATLGRNAAIVGIEIAIVRNGRDAAPSGAI